MFIRLLYGNDKGQTVRYDEKTDKQLLARYQTETSSCLFDTTRVFFTIYRGLLKSQLSYLVKGRGKLM